MALTLDEIIPLLADVNNVIQAGEAASKSLPADVDDLTNAVTIIKAAVPPLCDLILKVKQEADD